MSPRDDTNLFSDMRPLLNRPEVCLSLGPVVNIIIFPNIILMLIFSTISTF